MKTVSIRVTDIRNNKTVIVPNNKIDNIHNVDDVNDVCIEAIDYVIEENWENEITDENDNEQTRLQEIARQHYTATII